MKKEKKKRVKNYLNNADLLKQIELSRKRGQMTDELAKMFMMLVQRYARIPRFGGYSYNDDLQSFALLTICKVWKGFDPEKSQNPFAYFTQIAHHAFFQFDNQERKQRDIRDEMLLSQGKPASFGYMDRMADEDAYGDVDATEYHDREVSDLDSAESDIIPGASPEGGETENLLNA